MKESKLALNIGLVFLTIGFVLGLRMETAHTSYEIAKFHRDFKKQDSSTKLLSAKYQAEIGSEKIVSQANGMLAMKAPKSHQVVMISGKGRAFTR